MYEEIIRNLLTSLIPIIITGLIGWLGSRNVRSQRQKVFEDAKQRMELINAYIEAQKQVVDDAAELGAIKNLSLNRPQVTVTAPTRLEFLNFQRQ